MCGIVGYAGARQATSLLMEGLKRLEYRGYDSSGLAVVEGHAVLRLRAPGKLDNLEALLKTSPLKGSVALGHTRWATHRPSERTLIPRRLQQEPRRHP